MNIIKVTPRGYCKGVVKAIDIAKQTAIKYPNKKIYVLGMLVHNTYVSKALENLNIISIDKKDTTRYDLLDDINEGVVIFTAHGIHPKVIEKAKHKGLICIDASCVDVKRTQVLVNYYLNNNYDVLYIGKKNHPEAEANCFNNNSVHLIENIEDINNLNISNNNIFVTNQTTMSIKDVEQIYNTITIKYPNAIISEEICNATRIRQEAILNLDSSSIDMLIVVGDSKSNNSNRLAQLAKNIGISNVQLVDDVSTINLDNISLDSTVAITSGASTPTYLTNQVIEYLSNYPNVDLPTINIDKII